MLRHAFHIGLVATFVGSFAPLPAAAEVVVDTILFNATTNVVADGDDPPGLATAIGASSMQGGVDDPADAFGNNDGAVEPPTFIFGDGGTPDNGNQVLGDGGETVDFLEWKTIAPVVVAGYRIRLTEQDPFGRRTELVRFLVDGVERDFFDNDSAIGIPGMANDVDRPFGTPVTGSVFRLELTRASNGPRIHEIDALVDASASAQMNVNIAGTGSNPMAPAETAGAPGVASANWTNLSGSALAGGPVQVLGSDGLPIPEALASWTGFGQGDGLDDGVGSDDAKMFSSLFDARSYPAIEVTVTGIPYELYDLYAYHQGGAPPGVKRVARFTAGGTDLYSLRREDLAYVESTSTTDLGAATEPGSYVVFRGLDAPSVTLTVGGGSASDGFQRARFSGLQIVEADPAPPTTSSTTTTQPPSTTTTTPAATTTTTTTTLPVGAQLLTGKKLLLRDRAGKPQKRGLMLVSEDPVTSVGDGNGSAADPVLHGATLRVRSAAGDVFDDTYELPAGRWRYLGANGADKGYKLRPTKPIKAVQVKPGKGIKIVAQGLMGHSLGADPDPVEIELTLGDERYCFAFGGAAEHKPGKKYLATNAPAPMSCPPPG